METKTFTAIYCDYAKQDAQKFIATLCPGSVGTISTVMNPGNKDGFATWTTTVTYITL